MDLNNRVEVLESKVEFDELNYEQFFVEGYRSTEVGAQLSDLKSGSSNYNALINVTQGEVYKIRGVGGLTGRLWAKIRNGIVIETSNQSEENSETFFEITVDESFDQLNFNSYKKDNPYLCKVSIGIDDEVINLIDKSNKTLNQLNNLEYIKFKEVLNFDIAYAIPTKINTTIPVGSVVYLESDDGIDSLNCRTTSEISESPQLIKSGDIAEKDINYVRNLDKIGSVTILIENSYAGITHRINNINKKIDNSQSVLFDENYQMKQLAVTINSGSRIYLESENGITELNCRTTNDIQGESPQLVKNGDIAEKDINYVRCLTVLGTVNIYTDMIGLSF